MVPTQRKQIRPWLWIAVIALVAIGGALLWNTDNMKDRREWNGFRSELTDANVKEMAVSGDSGKRIPLGEVDRKEALRLLRGAKFDRSNRVGHGPTPGAFIYVTFAGRQEETIAILGADSFELHPDRHDPKAQFWIKSQELGAWLMGRFRGPTIG